MARPRRQKAGETRERVLAFVRGRLLAGAPPTVREVQQAFKFRAVQSAQEHLKALVVEGRLRKAEGHARGYRLPEGVSTPVLVPIVGRVEAGALTTAIESPEGYVAVEARGLGAIRDLFALRVRGDSMTGVGILPGDVVIVRRQRAANAGQVVVALVDNDATVKILRIHRGSVELHAANLAFQPIVIASEADFILLGVVIEVRRYLDGSSGRR